MKPNPDTLKQVVQSIVDGELDGFEESIYDALKARRRALTQVRAVTLNANQRVRIVRVRPNWLIGCTGKIIRLSPRSRTRFDVELDEVPAHAFNRLGQKEDKLQCGIPASCLQPIQ